MILGLLMGHGLAQSPEQWSKNLEVDPAYKQRMSVSPTLQIPPKIAYLNDSKIICAYYDDAIGDSVAAGSRPRFHVLEIDAVSGHLENSLSFSAADDLAAIGVVSNGFVVLAGGELSKYDIDFNKTATFSTPHITGGHVNFWALDVPPGGSQIALYRRSDTGKDQELIRLSNTNLARLSDEKAPFGRDASVSNSSYILDTTQDYCDDCLVHYLADDVVFVESRNRYFIESTAKKRLAKGGLSGWALDLTHAFHATRLAFLTGRYSGFEGHVPTSVVGKVVIIDWSLKKVIAEIPVAVSTGNPSAGLRQSALALSPDGTQLTLLLDSQLHTYLIGSGAR